MKPIILLVTLLCLLFVLNGYADDIDQYTARKLREAGTIRPLESILKNAKAKHDGRIVEVELKKKQNRYVYEISLIDAKGIVWEMKYNAKTGSLLSSERED